ncbi:SAM-dependent methyltransferase [Actinoallomurus acanthiterrae]
MTNNQDSGAAWHGPVGERASQGVDFTKPSPARIYDVFLGGKDNFAVDRAAASVALKVGPDIPRAARDNRAFLARAVQFAIASGIRQFIDLGTGLPTQGNVHEVAQSLDPGARVIYVDNDPVVLVHARALLRSSRTIDVIQADLREPTVILNHPSTRALIDFNEPVAVLMLAVLNFVTDEEAQNTIGAFREAVPQDSLLILSHGTGEGHPEIQGQAARTWANATSQIRSRSRTDVEALFAGFDLLDPGVVWVPQWRPAVAHPSDTRWMYAGVGRKN